MTLAFKKAMKKTTKARIALMGPSGSGKTLTALLLAAGLGKRIAVLDTEHGSASKYAGEPKVPDFDALDLESFSPERYVEAIGAAEAAGYDVLIIDSLSHAWSGKDGALEQVDRAAKRSQSGNTFMAWRDVTPQHNALIEAMVRCRCHLIATMRTKTDYVIEEVQRNGKTVKQPRRIGLAPVQRDGMEYEFDIVADITLDHDLIVTKSRCSALDGAVVGKPGEALGKTIGAWLSDGAPAPAPELARTQELPKRESAPPVDSDTSPIIDFKGHPLNGQRASKLDSVRLVKFVRALQKVGAGSVYLKSVVDYAATRGIVDFSDKAEKRTAELAAAVGGKLPLNEDDLHTWLHPDGADIRPEFKDIRAWVNAEHLIEFGAWIEKNPHVDNARERMLRVEACLKKLVDAEAKRADEALAERPALTG